MRKGSDKSYNDIVRSIRNDIDAGRNSCFSVSGLADAYGIPVRVLQDYFKLFFNVSPKEYLNNKWLERLILMIKTDSRSKELLIVNCAEKLGFSRSSSLCNFVKRMTGMTFRELCDAVQNGRI